MLKKRQRQLRFFNLPLNRVIELGTQVDVSLNQSPGALRYRGLFAVWQLNEPCADTLWERAARSTQAGTCLK
jgi:hypothetical protein